MFYSDKQRNEYRTMSKRAAYDEAYRLYRLARKTGLDVLYDLLNAIAFYHESAVSNAYMSIMAII